MEDDVILSDNAELTQNSIAKVVKKRKHRLLKTSVIIAVAISAIVLSFGFIFPGLLWTKDLGVRYSIQDYDSFMEKIDYTKDLTPTGYLREDYVYTYGKVSSIDTSFTSAELTAFANYNRPVYYAFKDVQILINDDGTIEASASVNVDYVLNEVLGGKYTRSEIEKEIPALGFLPSNVNLYLNIEGSIINNSTNLSLNSVVVQGIAIPENFINTNEAIETVTNGINDLISKNNSASGSNIKNLSTENNQLLLIGEFPTSLTRIKK